MPLRILHVIPGITRERGGPTAVLEALTRAQTKQGHAVQVLTTDQGESLGEHAIAFHPDVEVVKRSMLGPDGIGYAPLFRTTAKQLMSAVDVIHVHSLFNYPTEVACRTARQVSRPFIVRPCGVLHPHGLAHRSFKKWLFLRLMGGGFRRAAAIHCATIQEAELSAAQFEPAPAFVVPNGLNVDEYEGVDFREAAEEARREFRLPDRPYVLFLGRLHPIKGLEVLLPGFLKGSTAETQLVLAGPEDRQYGKKIRNLVDDLGLSERTHFVGPVYGRPKVALLMAARVFALSSQYESFGNVVVESLAAGTPVLLSKRIDLATEVAAAGLGWMVDPAADAWAAAIAARLAAPAWSDAERRQAQRWCAARYGWAHVAEQLEAQYRRFCFAQASVT